MFDSKSDGTGALLFAMGCLFIAIVSFTLAIVRGGVYGAVNSLLNFANEVHEGGALGRPGAAGRQRLPDSHRRRDLDADVLRLAARHSARRCGGLRAPGARQCVRRSCRRREYQNLAAGCGE